MIKKSNTLKEIFTEALKSYKGKNLKTAENLCYKILSIDPNHFGSVFLLANISAINNNFKNAKKLLEKAIEIDPKNLSAINNLATAHKELGELNESIKLYEKTLEISPNNPNALYNLGVVFFILKDFKKAKNYFKKTIEVQPNYVIAHFNLGNVQAELKEYEEAKKSYKKVIELKPDYASAHNNLGLIFRAFGDYKGAINSYKKVIEIFPKHAGAYNNMGRAFTEMGEFEKAIEAHKNATDIEPENLYHYFYLSELKKDFLNSELEKKVVNILNKGKSTKTNNAYGNFLLSRYEKNKKNYKKEVEYLIKAHGHYFDIKKEKFELGIKYCFEDVLQISNFASVTKSDTEKVSEVKPIFIVGVPRCGSTLVEKIIGSCRELIPMGEEIAILENFINYKILKKQSISLGKADDISKELIEIYNKKNLVKKDKGYAFTDKSLNNFFYLQIIKDIFPKAKIINCKRSVLASIMSIMQNNLTELAWAHKLENIFKYFDIYFNTIAKFNEKNPDLMYELEFENFTNNPEDESKKLLKFCELTWDKKCLEYYKRKDIISKTTSYQQVRKAVYKNSSERYLPYKEILNEYGSKYSWFK